LLAFFAAGDGGVLLSLGDFRAPAFSLRVTRGDVGLDEEFELFMQLLGTYCGCYVELGIGLDHSEIVAIS
jgi:hypothetical protein